MSENRIEKQIVLKAKPSRVWRAISDSAEFGKWFGVHFTEPFVAGRTMKGVTVPTEADPKEAEAQRDFEGLDLELVIDRIEPETLFSFRWHPFAIEKNVDYSKEKMTLVVFTLAPVADGVKLTITETGFDELPTARRAPSFAANSDGWAVQSVMLEKWLARAG